MLIFTHEETIAEARRMQRAQRVLWQQPGGATVETTLVERHEHARLAARSTLMRDDDGSPRADPEEGSWPCGAGVAAIDVVPPREDRSRSFGKVLESLPERGGLHG